jgi:hypothetical protein
MLFSTNDAALTLTSLQILKVWSWFWPNLVLINSDFKNNLGTLKK